MGSKTSTKKEPKKSKAQEKASTAQEPQPENNVPKPEDESTPEPELMSTRDMQTIIEALAKTVSEHTGQITELQAELARKRKPTQSDRVQIRDRQTGKTYPSKNNCYRTDRNFDIEIQRKMRDSQKMNTELGEKRSELSGIKELIQGLKDDIAVVKAVIRFLAAPDMLADSDFSGLLGVFLDARRDRMVMSARLHDVMECPENPVILGRFESALMMYDQKLNGFRGRLAFYLLPLLE